MVLFVIVKTCGTVFIDMKCVSGIGCNILYRSKIKTLFTYDTCSMNLNGVLGVTLSSTGLLLKLTHLADIITCGSFSDYKKELRSLNRELQLHILELADILVERPSQYARRVEEISLIFKNLHHLLNSLRPHQVDTLKHFKLVYPYW